MILKLSVRIPCAVCITSAVSMRTPSTARLLGGASRRDLPQLNARSRVRVRFWSGSSLIQVLYHLLVLFFRDLSFSVAFSKYVVGFVAVPPIPSPMSICPRGK